MAEEPDKTDEAQQQTGTYDTSNNVLRRKGSTELAATGKAVPLRAAEVAREASRYAPDLGAIMRDSERNSLGAQLEKFNRTLADLAAIQKSCEASYVSAASIAKLVSEQCPSLEIKRIWKTRGAFVHRSGP
jgi:hypothetical protein